MMEPLRDHQLCVFLSFLFAQVHFCLGSNKNLSVLQLPISLTLTEGENASIQCSWNKTEQRIKVNWLKNGTKWMESSKRIEINSAQENLVIHNTSRNDSGFYVCEVIQETPKLHKHLGGGTQVTVNSKTNSITTETKQSGKPGLPLAVTVSLAVIGGLLVICVSLGIWRIRMTGQQHENTIIREMVATDSEEPRNMDEQGEDSSCNSSRGSTQWCQVPVYEAYFDHRRDCDDGEKDSQ
ncbi:hypothetical protein ACEWY4_025382 [Coilia grayii]|uniref:Ig-like domain-containing protein n=1 Tax=Coilia grayii TaxID=363190 RepID=A0ABD1J160_9TELE